MNSKHDHLRPEYSENHRTAASEKQATVLRWMLYKHRDIGQVNIAAHFACAFDLTARHAAYPRLDLAARMGVQVIKHACGGPSC
jgi:hypothetical protein